MTLNFTKTASECAEARLLYPAFRTHFFHDFGLPRRRDTAFVDPRIRPGLAYDELMYYLVDEGLVPDDKYWHRTRRDMRTRHGRYRLRTILREWEANERRGKTCLCGTACRYPEAPSDY